MSPSNIYIIVLVIYSIVIGYDVVDWIRGRKFDTPALKLKRFREKINVSVVILGLTCLGAAVLFHVNVLQYRAPMGFDEITLITLRDFKGYRLPNQTLYGEKEFAFIVTSIDWNLSNNHVEVKALFHPSRSYVFNKNTSDKYLLEHELCHFRITEVMARKARKELSEIDQVPNSSEIKDIVDNYQSLENRMQMQYDQETYHGYISKNQKAWQLKVDSLLSLLNKFSDPTITYPN